MASIDTSYVRRELRAIAGSSKAVRKLLYEALEKLEHEPSSFEELTTVPRQMQEDYPGVTWRKLKIQSGRHNYRLVFAHWRLAEQEDHVDVLYAFARRDGYPIDWKWVRDVLGG